MPTCSYYCLVVMCLCCINTSSPSLSVYLLADLLLCFLKHQFCIAAGFLGELFIRSVVSAAMRVQIGSISLSMRAPEGSNYPWLLCLRFSAAASALVSKRQDSPPAYDVLQILAPPLCRSDPTSGPANIERDINKLLLQSYLWDG